MKGVGVALAIGLVGLVWVSTVEAQVRMVPKNITEVYYQPVQRAYTYWQVVYKPVSRTYACTQYRYSGGRMVPYTATCSYMSYQYSYTPITYYYTYYEPRTRTRMEMVAVPDIKSLTDRLELAKEMARDRQSMEADLARISSETQELFKKNRLTEDFQMSSESLGEERFLESFSTWSLARAVHVVR